MRYCSASNCFNAKEKPGCRTKTFFKFPLKNPALLKEWTEKIARKDFKPTPYCVLCSDHFEDICFTHCPFTRRRILKPDAVPTQFIFSKKQSSKTLKEREETSQASLPSTSSETVADDRQQNGLKLGVLSVATQTEHTFADVIDELRVKQNEVQELREALNKKVFVPDNISNDTKMKALTGFTRERFFSIYSFLNIEEGLKKLNISKRPIDLFFLFLVKLKTGISNEFLSILFDISDSTVSRYFNFVSDALYEKLKGDQNQKLLNLNETESVESLFTALHSLNRNQAAEDYKTEPEEYTAEHYLF